MKKLELKKSTITKLSHTHLEKAKGGTNSDDPRSERCVTGTTCTGFDSCAWNCSTDINCATFQCPTLNENCASQACLSVFICL